MSNHILGDTELQYTIEQYIRIEINPPLVRGNRYQLVENSKQRTGISTIDGDVLFRDALICNILFNSLLVVLVADDNP